MLAAFLHTVYGVFEEGAPLSRNAGFKRMTQTHLSHARVYWGQERALMKLQQLHAAGNLKDLSIPASNQLEPLQGNRKDEHSIRINKQWRICFKWKDGHAWEVEIADYH